MPVGRKRERESGETKTYTSTFDQRLKVAQFLCFTNNYIWNSGAGSCLTEIIAEVGCD